MFVQIFADPNFGVDGSAEFYSEAPAGNPLAGIDDGECVDIADLDIGGTFTYEDVGATVTAVSGATTITMDQVIDGDEIYYEGFEDPAPEDADYEISIGADVLGSVHVPPFPGTVAYTGGEVTWSPMSADEVVLAVVDDGFNEIWFCYADDDGAVTLPGDVLAAIPTGQVTLNAHNRTTVDRNGRDVTLTGSVSGESVDF